MNKNFFKGEMQKLINQFGEKSFSEHKVNLIYKAINRLEDRELASIIDDIVGNSRFAPTLNEIKEKSAGYLRDKLKHNPVACNFCRSTGQVVVYLRDNSYPCAYAFACTCVNGEQYPAYPKWNDYKRAEFTQLPQKAIWAK